MTMSTTLRHRSYIETLGLDEREQRLKLLASNGRERQRRAILHLNLHVKVARNQRRLIATDAQEFNGGDVVETKVPATVSGDVSAFRSFVLSFVCVMKWMKWKRRKKHEAKRENP